MNELSILLKYLKPYRKNLFLNALFNLLSSIFAIFSLFMLIPFLRILFGLNENIPANTESKTYLFQKNIEQLFHVLGKTTSSTLTLLAFICIFALFVFLLKNAFRYLALYFLSDVKKGVVRDIRQQIYNSMLHMPLEKLQKNKKGHFISISTNDLLEIEYGIIHFMESMIKEPLLILITLISLLLISPSLTLLVLLIIPFSILIIAFVTRRLRRVSQKTQQKLSEIASITEESMTGIKTIRSFNAEENFEEKYRELNRDHFELGVKALRSRDLASPLSEFLGLSIVIGILFIGGSMVLTKYNLAPELLITYIVILSQVIAPAKAFSNASAYIKKANASLQQIQEFCDYEEKVSVPEKQFDIKDFKDKIIFENVEFFGEGNPILKSVNIEIPKNKFVAIVGESGSGKSTLINLLLKFYSPHSGKITIDGSDVAIINDQSIRDLVSYVSQDVNLFNLTLEENIFLLNKFKDEKLVQQLFLDLGLQKLLNEREGLKIIAGNDGHKLSGGERQRIAIARALYKDAPVLIFDEATASIDVENEQILLNLLRKLQGQKTIIFITHRIQSVAGADIIYVMQEGKVVEKGNHAELLSMGGKYASYSKER